MAEHLICKRSDLAPGRLVRAQAGRLPVVVTLLDGAPIAVVARCPHQGADLSAGSVVDHVDATPDGAIVTNPDRLLLRCPWHGFEYDLSTGEPCVPSPEHRRLRLRRLPARVQGDDIVVDV